MLLNCWKNIHFVPIFSVCYVLLLEETVKSVRPHAELMASDI